MNKKHLILSIVLIFISSLGYADTNWDTNQSGTPTVFKVKPVQMWLCESYNVTTGVCTGDNIFNIVSTITEDDGRCDIAGVAPGAVACSMGSTSAIPKNVEYRYMRMELDRNMWLTGTLTNSLQSNVSLASCHTDSSNASTAGYVSEGSTGGTASEQGLRFSDGPGNEDFQGNAAIGVANTTDTYWNSCFGDSNLPGCNAWSTIQFIEDNGGTAYDGTNSGSRDYNIMNDYSVPVGPVWQGGLAPSEPNMFMIYALSSPYTRTLDTNPTIKMSFDVTDGLDGDFIKSTEGSSEVEGCTLYVGNPGVAITISD